MYNCWVKFLKKSQVKNLTILSSLILLTPIVLSVLTSIKSIIIIWGIQDSIKKLALRI